MNDQRKVIYEQRKDLMRSESVQDTIVSMRNDVVEAQVSRFIPAKAYHEQWEVDSLHQECLRLFGLDLPIADWAKEEGIADQEILERIKGEVERKLAAKAANFGPDIMRMAEKQVLLTVLDKQWKDHLLSLDHLRHGIGLRAYGQRDPLNEYKREAFDLFEEMLAHTREETTMLLSHVEIRVPDAEAIARRREAEMQRQAQQMRETRQDPALAGSGAPQGALQGTTMAEAAVADPSNPESWGKVPRNAVCPCGSGKKFKHCHGRMA
jgi:preprotein translocase subunit SecA